MEWLEDSTLSQGHAMMSLAVIIELWDREILFKEKEISSLMI